MRQRYPRRRSKEPVRSYPPPPSAAADASATLRPPQTPAEVPFSVVDRRISLPADPRDGVGERSL
jgi:hypothetical protein